MKTTALFALFLIALFTLNIQADAPPKNMPTHLEPILLWPGVAPGDKPDMPPEKVTTNKDNVAIMGNVSKPMITVFKPAADKDTGAAVIVCPGGGYSILAYDLEGTEVCDWLNSLGVTGVLLKYRVPGRGEHKYTAPLQDAQRAIGMVRSHAKEWSIDPNRIGILGFSAGGHLAAAASNNYDTRTYPAVDDSDKESCRPDFTILIYPAYLTADKDLTKIAPEVTVNSKTPPAFMTMAEDDPVHVENVYIYSQALKAAKVRSEVHIFPTGGHGYGLRPGKNPISTAWPVLAGEWMKAQGFLAAK